MQSAKSIVWMAGLFQVYPNVLTILCKSDLGFPVLLWGSTYLAWTPQAHQYS